MGPVGVGGPGKASDTGPSLVMGIVSTWGGTLQLRPFARPAGVVSGWLFGRGGTVKTKVHLGPAGRQDDRGGVHVSSGADYGSGAS